MRDRLAIIGASYLQKPLVEKAREMGYETHVFAWEAGAVCKDIADHFYPVSITETDEILRICRKIQPKGIVSIGSDLATVAVNQIAEKLGLIGNSLECTQVTTNKFLMRERLHSRGIPSPRYWLAESGGSVPELEEADLPLIVKPVDRSGSRGVTLVRDRSELIHAILAARAESFCSQVIIEQFIEGRELSVESISWQGKHYILQFTDKETTGSPHFIEKAHHQPADLTAGQVMALSQVITESLDCLGIEYGASHSEIMIDPRGDIYVIEIGARMGGDCIGSHLVQLSTGYDYLKAVVEIAAGSFNEPVMTMVNHSGIHYVFPPPGLLNAVIFKGDDHVVDHEILVGMGERIPEIINSSQRPGYYIYQACQKMAFDPEQLVLQTKQDRQNDTL